jgi:hypothetical protein
MAMNIDWIYQYERYLLEPRERERNGGQIAKIAMLSVKVDRHCVSSHILEGLLHIS